MRKVTAKDFGLRCESRFVAPKAYDEAFLGRFVSTVLLEFGSFGIGPPNFAKNEGDRLFGYGISFSLFSGNAAFALGRDGLISTILNGQNQSDAELIKDLLNRGHRCLPELEKMTHVMNGFCHAEFLDGGKPEDVFRDLIKTSGAVKPVGASVLSEDSTEAILPPNERLRLDVAPSDLRENRLFMSWHFVARGVISEDYWRVLAPRLNAIAGSVGIEVV